jgi:hypothetical protein
MSGARMIVLRSDQIPAYFAVLISGEPYRAAA